MTFKKNSTSPLSEGIPDFKVYTEQYCLNLDPSCDVLSTTRIDSLSPHAANGPFDMPVV